MAPKMPKHIRNTLNAAFDNGKFLRPPFALIKYKDGSMKPSDAAPRDPEILRKSTKLGMTIEAAVTMIMISTLSVYILRLCLNFVSLGSLKKDRSSIISKAQSIYNG